MLLPVGKKTLDSRTMAQRRPGDSWATTPAHPGPGEFGSVRASVGSLRACGKEPGEQQAMPGLAQTGWRDNCCCVKQSALAVSQGGQSVQGQTDHSLNGACTQDA